MGSGRYKQFTHRRRPQIPHFINDFISNGLLLSWFLFRTVLNFKINTNWQSITITLMIYIYKYCRNFYRDDIMIWSLSETQKAHITNRQIYIIQRVLIQTLTIITFCSILYRIDTGDTCSGNLEAFCAWPIWCAC